MTKNVLSGVMGLAVGDALGVPAEFMTRARLALDPVTGMRGGGFHNQTPGTWSDDTSMNLAFMDSVAECGRIDEDDIMARFSRWMSGGEYTAHGRCFDAGGATRSAIHKYLSGVPAAECGGKGEFSCGNGSLMRILPAAFIVRAHIGNGPFTDAAAGAINRISSVTHAHPICLVACGIYVSMAISVMREGNRRDMGEALCEGYERAADYYNKPAYSKTMQKFDGPRQIGSKPLGDISGGGFVADTLQAAVWCLMNASSYEECVTRAVSLGDDTDTTAAVAGGLAGLYYGYDAIPEMWLCMLAKREELEAAARRFAACAGNIPLA